MKNKLVFACVILVLLAMGAGAGSLVYSAVFLASSLANRLLWLQWIPIASYTILAIVVLIAVYFAFGIVRQSRVMPLPKLGDSAFLPMTIVIPTLNEERTLEQCVGSIMKAWYPPGRLEVIIAYEVSPKCRDSTPAIAERLAARYPNVRAVPNNGDHKSSKAGAVNNCYRSASGAIIGIYDADHVIERDALARASVQFAADPALGCIGGKVLVRNMDYNMFTFLIGNEYTVINNFSRFLSELLTGTHLIYGSNVYIRKEALEAIGGFDESSLTEDCDLGMKLIAKNYNMRIDYTIRSYEQPAINLHDWWHQRVRWTRGSVDVLKKYVRDVRGGVNLRMVQTIVLYSLGTGGLLFSVILIGFLGFLLYVDVVPPVILAAFSAPLAILFAAESILQMKEGRGSLADVAMSLFVRPWIIFVYSLVGVYAVVLDVLDAERTWAENQRI